MKKCLMFLLLLTVISVEASDGNEYRIPKTQVIPIHDTQNDRQYELYIKLPEGYPETQETRYPVIYFTDAVWHIEILSAATEFLMEDAILVGISWQTDNDEDLIEERGIQVSRYRDYTIVESENPEIQAKYQPGQAANHLAFIRKDVIASIERDYQTDPGRRTYFGYSASGLFGAFILVSEPETFQNYILGSPSLDGDIPRLTELAAESEIGLKDFNANVYMSYGALEHELGGFVEEFITLVNNQNAKGLQFHKDVIEGSHQTAFPLTGVRSVTWLSNLQQETE